MSLTPDIAGLRDLLEKVTPGPRVLTLADDGAWSIENAASGRTICSRNPWEHRVAESGANGQLIYALFVNAEALLNAAEAGQRAQDALASFLREGESDDADDCELCDGTGEVLAITARARGSRGGEHENVGCPLCIERAHSERAQAAIHSLKLTSGKETTT